MSRTRPLLVLRSSPSRHLSTTTPTSTSPKTQQTRQLHLHRNHQPYQSRPTHRHPPFRPYHSPSHPSSPSYTPTETAILEASLPHIPIHGFTPQALRLGALDANYLSISTNLFPSPTTTLLTYHLTTARSALAEHPLPYPSDERDSTTNNKASAVKANLTSLLLKRLDSSRPYVEHLPAALAALSPPTALHELYLVADEILYLAGNMTVTAPGWYLDRAGVGGMYAASELFMMQQAGQDGVGELGWAETEAFVRRRVEEGGNIRAVGSGVKEWVGGQVGGLVDGVRVLGWRI